MKATVVNNYGKDIKNPKILGRIPFQGNKKTDGTELGSTLNTVLTSGLTVSGIDNNLVTIYYSENGDATADLNNSANGWTQDLTDTSKIKSYLVVFNDYVMPQATSFDMAYNVQVPENLSHNENAFGTYTVYYEEDENVVHIQVLVVVDRDNIKKIVIGKNGAMLKEIGSRARHDMEKFLGKKVYLETYVKTLKNWRDEEKYFLELGLKEEDE